MYVYIYEVQISVCQPYFYCLSESLASKLLYVLTIGNIFTHDMF